jgi:hypothetical protein
VLKTPKKTHQNPPNPPSRLGDKKTRAPNITFYPASQIRVFRARNLSDPRRLSTGFTSRLLALAKQADGKFIRLFQSCKRFFNLFLHNENTLKTAFHCFFSRLNGPGLSFA